MRAPDLVAPGPPARAADPGNRSAPATARSAALFQIRDILLIKILPVRACWVPRATLASGWSELREQRGQIAEGLAALAGAELGQLTARLGERVQQPPGR